MRYRCSDCKKETWPNALTFKASFVSPIKEEIDRIHPNWTNDDALCLKCLLDLRKYLNNRAQS